MSPPPLPRGMVHSILQQEPPTFRVDPGGLVHTWFAEAPRSRPQPHPNRPAPLPPIPVTPRQPAHLITHPSPPDATPAKTAQSTPRATRPRSLLQPNMPRASRSPPPPELPPLLALRLTMDCTPTHCHSTTLGLFLAPPGQLPGHGPDPTCRRPHNLQQMTMIMTSAAPPPRS